MYEPLDMEALVCGVMPIESCAVPLPHDFEQYLPLALVTRTGGQEIERVLDRHSLSIDVYASTWTEANRLARRCVSALREAEGGAFRRVEANVPYDNTDTAHPDIPRVTFTAAIVERTEKEA